MFFLKSIRTLSSTQLAFSKSRNPSSLEIFLHSNSELFRLRLNGSYLTTDQSLSFDQAVITTGLQLLRNRTQGEGYFIELILKGIGFKIFRFGNQLFLQLGYSHFYVYNVPSNLVVKAKRDRIVIFGLDKQLVGKVVYDLYSLRRPDAYKAKGVQYRDRTYVLKEGKKK